jgi:hypothetical protein
MKTLVYIGAGVTPPQTEPRVSVMQTASVLGPNLIVSGKART